jgi:hypothetical protein
MEYPVKKFDHLNRLIYVDWNGIERCINIYWGDTNKVKIKYRLWNQEAEVEAYDKNGNVVFETISGAPVLKFPRLKIEKGRIAYCVDKKKVNEWMLKLECHKK